MTRPETWTLAPVMTLMPLASNAWPSTGEMLASAPGNEPGTGFDEPDVGSEVGETEAIWHPVSARPMTVTWCGRALKVKMS